MADVVFIHPQALCESGDIGAGTRVWAFAHVMEGAHIGRNCNICDHCFVESGAWIGDGVTIKNNVMVWNGVHIEDGAFIGPGAVFTNELRPRSTRNPEQPALAARRADPENWLLGTRVERGAAIGANAVIMPGLKIGAYAMVGAGAVVTKNVGAYALATGNPARQIGFVGPSGARLNEIDTGVWECPETGARFRQTGDGLEHLEG